MEQRERRETFAKLLPKNATDAVHVLFDNHNAQLPIQSKVPPRRAAGSERQ